MNRLIINQEEMIIGSDPEKANLLLEDSSIHPGHARIEAENQTDFLIYDMGSDAGTYVNYQPVDQNGTRIEHLDIVHFGCFGFCFEVKNPATIKDIKINLI